jgi:ADP-heptose:LPS heptosyltransferase
VTPERVLIILLGAIGDVVCGMPLAQRLRAGWPETRIAWAVEPPAAPLLQTHAAVDEMIVFRRGHGTAALIEFLRAVRDSRPDLTLDLQRHFKSGLTSWCSGAARRVGFHWRNSREGNRLFNTDAIWPVRDFTPKLSLRFADYLGVPHAPVIRAARHARRAPAGGALPRAGGRAVRGAVRRLHLGRQWQPDRPPQSRPRARGPGAVLVGGPTDVLSASAVLRWRRRCVDGVGALRPR